MMNFQNKKKAILLQDIVKINYDNINCSDSLEEQNKLSGVKIYDQKDVESTIYNQVDLALDLHDLKHRERSLLLEIADLEKQKQNTTFNIRNYLSNRLSHKSINNIDELIENLKKELINIIIAKKRLKNSRNVSLPKKIEEQASSTNIYYKKIKTLSFKDDSNVDIYVSRINRLNSHTFVWIFDENDTVNDNGNNFFNYTKDFKLPLFIQNKLFEHQRQAIKWMLNLHETNCGGIIGDDMGLGKTIQVISFLITLSINYIEQHYSKVQMKSDDITDPIKYLCMFNKLKGPVLIVCPVTIMHQWLQEFHYWWPFFKVYILHKSSMVKDPLVKRSKIFRMKKLINDAVANGGICITTYSNLVINKDILTQPWYYIFLDEGHKIRNPESQVSKSAKIVANYNESLLSDHECHRFILTGTPMQNQLKELWTLIDFIYPGKLGTLKAFSDNIANPIQAGGYANASQVQIAAAYKCACILKDSINPYLLRRTKTDVDFVRNLNLPKKNEQVLFCQITDYQKRLYQEYLSTFDIQDILTGRLKIFKALITLRKLCNHPDLVTHCYNERYDDDNIHAKDNDKFSENAESKWSKERAYGYWKRSGKMRVLKELLKIWHQQNHKVLIFSQTRQMLDIIEKFVISKTYTYVRLDGSYSVKARHDIVHRFNTSLNADSDNIDNASIFAFLLTTRVGGLGLNLTAANKVVIFDPDWNPCVDGQAKERSWRIGQLRDVSIYRLILAGTVEEKIYHRQIFKQYLTNKVLNDPKINNRLIFKTNDIRELFTLFDDVTPQESKQEGESLRDKTTLPCKSSKRLKEEHAQCSTSAPCINLPNHRKRYVKVEGQEVMYLTKRENYKNRTDDKADEKLPKNSSEFHQSQDTYVLNKILGNSFVTGNLSHDSLFNNYIPRHGGASDKNERRLGNLVINEVADTIARNAVQKIIESREVYHAKLNDTVVTAISPSSSRRPKSKRETPITLNKPPTIDTASNNLKKKKSNEQLFFDQLFSNPISVKRMMLSDAKVKGGIVVNDKNLKHRFDLSEEGVITEVELTKNNNNYIIPESSRMIGEGCQNINHGQRAIIITEEKEANEEADETTAKPLSSSALLAIIKDRQKREDV